MCIRLFLAAQRYEKKASYSVNVAQKYTQKLQNYGLPCVKITIIYRLSPYSSFLGKTTAIVFR